MDKASASGAGDSRFESWAGQGMAKYIRDTFDFPCLLSCRGAALLRNHCGGVRVASAKAGSSELKLAHCRFASRNHLLSANPSAS